MSSHPLIDVVAPELAKVSPGRPGLALANGSADEDTERPRPRADINLSADFWVARPDLDAICRAAHCRARSADAVLGVVLARIAALTPPTITLPTPVGSSGTLDYAVVLIGHSGAGKSTSARTGAELVPILDGDVAVLPMGSGEGIGEAFMGDVEEVGEDGKTHIVKKQVRRGLLATLDEGQALTDLGSRRGSTLLPTIRTAWSGDTLGQANASKETRRHLPAGSYRFAMIAGFQPLHAVELLKDAAGGTPQRMLWLAAEDPTIPDEAPSWPGPLDWAPPQHQAGPMGLDTDVSTEIRAAALRRARGEEIVDELDAHRDLVRLKTAALLAILDDRLHVTAEDWRLAGMIVDTSDAVRSHVIATAAAQRDREERGRISAGIRREAAMQDASERRARQGGARAIARKVHHSAGADGLTRTQALSTVSGQHKKLASRDDMIDTALAEGWIAIDDEGRFHPGEARP